jgi:hypothetical protein
MRYNRTGGTWKEAAKDIVLEFVEGDSGKTTNFLRISNFHLEFELNTS